MAVFWKIIRILAETSAAAECSLDNTHCRFCHKRKHIHSTLEVANRTQTLYFISVCITKHPFLTASIYRFLVTLSPEMQVETKADVRVFWLYIVRPLGLQHSSPMTILTDRGKWTSICSSCVDKLKKKSPNLGLFIKIL